MSTTATTSPAPATKTSRADPVAALLSYAVPGLGQIVQGRVGKGLLFLICINGLFFYGMAMGRWSNVYLGDTAVRAPAWNLPRWANNLYNRPQFAAQFWVGAAAWPAIWQYWRRTPDQPRGSIDTWQDFIAKFEAAPSEAELNDFQRDSDKRWDLGWVYTVIAGVLNILVIYDAFAGPAFGLREPSHEKDRAP